MNKICTLVTVGALAMGLATSAFAQAAGPKGGAPGQDKGQKQGQGTLRDRAQGMQKANQAILDKLNLTDKQKTQIEALKKKEQAAGQALREKAKAGGDRAAMKAEVMKLRKDAQEGLKQILTEKQQTQYQELLKAAKAKRKGGKAGKGGGGL